MRLRTLDKFARFSRHLSSQILKFRRCRQRPAKIYGKYVIDTIHENFELVQIKRAVGNGIIVDRPNALIFETFFK